MALEIKYSDNLANNEAAQVRLKCSWADLDVIDVSDNSIKKILLTVKKPSLGYSPLRITPYNSVMAYGEKMIGIATGNYVDILGDRYIEIKVIPSEYLMSCIISKQQIYEEYIKSLTSPVSSERTRLLNDMYKGKGYDTNKYKLTYTIPDTAYVRLKSVVLYDGETKVDNNTIEKDSSTILSAKSNNSTLLLGLATLLLLD